MKIYMLGIGGVSMSALAIILTRYGHDVSGWDCCYGRGVEILEAYGIKVDCPCQKNENAYKNSFEGLAKCDLVVNSSAIKSDDPHMLFAKERNIKSISRGQLLGAISSKFEKVVAVAGSHGKTTTTAMIYNILKVAGKNPTLHLGGYKIDDGLNFNLGEKEFFVTEACEYHDNFLYLRPYISVVTNVEKEHMDYFKTFKNEKKSFKTFCDNSRFVVDSTAGLVAKKVMHDKFGGLKFSLLDGQKPIMDLHLKICEEINTQNCMYAYLVARQLGLSDCIIKQGLETFEGVGTRFERKKSSYFDTVICDYAHHPTEISKAISSAEKIFKGKHLVTIFQPHTYSRTKSLLPQFVEVFKNLPDPLFFKTYSAREDPSEGLSSEDLTNILRKSNKHAKYFDDFQDLKKYLQINFAKDSVLLFLGAGDLPLIIKQDGFVS